MAGVTESNNWSPEVYRFETEDVVKGGEDGLDNLPGKQLAGRTNWLRLMLTAVCAAEGVTVLDNETTQFLTALDSRIGNAISALVDSSPAALDTLNELAAALGDDPNFATTVTNALALKAPLASPALSGIPTAPTADPGTSDNQIANTEFVQQAIAEISSEASLQGGFRNLKASATGTNALVSITIDELVTGDGAGNYLATRNWNDTLNLALPGPGGLDTGAVAASTWYYIFGITKDDGSKKYIASLSANAPTLSGDFTKWARIGSFRTDATANKYPLAFNQRGRKVAYKVSPGTNVESLRIMANGAAGDAGTPTFVSVSTSNFVPATATFIDVVLRTGNVTSAICAPNPNYGGHDSISNPAPLSGIFSAGTFAITTSRLIMLESSNIYWASSGTNPSDNVLACAGWVDNF